MQKMVPCKGRLGGPFLVAVLAIAALLAACSSGDETRPPDAVPRDVPGAAAHALTSSAADEGIRSMSPEELVDLLDREGGPVVLDVRSRREYEAGHIPSAINIPFDSIGDRLGDLEAFRERGLVIYCRSGRRAGIAERELAAAGFEKLWDLEGHMETWTARGLPADRRELCC